MTLAKRAEATMPLVQNRQVADKKDINQFPGKLKPKGRNIVTTPKFMIYDEVGPCASGGSGDWPPANTPL
jgi:hypothetical protein